MIKKLVEYLKEVKAELKRVNWLTREQTIRYTFIIIGVSLVIALFLGGLDYVFSLVLNRFVL